MATKANHEIEKRTNDEIVDIVGRAQQGDATALGPLRELLKEMPYLVDALQGNLVSLIESRYAEKLGSKNLAFMEALKRKVQTIRDDLEGPEPTPIEKMLIDRIAVCWLHLQHAELVYALKEGRTIHQADYQQKRIDRAHRRFISALKALATVRRLAVPVLIAQMNVAQNQVAISQ